MSVASCEEMQQQLSSLKTSDPDEHEDSGSLGSESLDNSINNGEDHLEPAIFDHTFNVLLLGDSGVGKSDLVARLSSVAEDQSFKNQFFATIGINVETHFLEIDNQRIKLQIWDPSGSERFNSMIKTYFRTAHGVLLVYDLNYKTSFQSIQDWTRQLQKHPDLNYESIAKILVGNKSDVQRRAVSQEEAGAFATNNQLRFLETSTITGENVESCFRHLCQDMLRLNPNKTEAGDKDKNN